MNERFYQLPDEKQKKIINAGFSVFSRNSYKKSPMSEIADAAGISKSLLFHYFYNKKELYLFLWEECCRITIQFMEKYDCYGQTDLFEMLERGMRVKIRLMKLYPDLGVFALQVFYEKDPEVCSEIQQSYRKYYDYKAKAAILNLDPAQFIPGLDIPMMYKEMYWASEGYILERMRCGEVDIEKMEADFKAMIQFWKKIYLRKEEAHGSHKDNESDEILR